jgi:transcriptional regulator with XRE-family HTH domain
LLSQDEEKTFNKLAGQRIRHARESAGVKQEVLSNFLGFKSRISITNIESGKQNIQITTLAEIAEYLKVDVSSLVPPLEIIKKDVNRKLVRNLGKDGVANGDSLERIKGFIRFTASKK